MSIHHKKHYLSDQLFSESSGNYFTIAVTLVILEKYI